MIFLVAHRGGWRAGRLKEVGIQISIDGKSRSADYLFGERPRC